MTQHLGKYEILGEIGRGGFATVYRARDPDLDREVALKVLDPALMRDPSLVERFRREARAAARLRHPGIVTIHEIGQAEGLLFIAMELLPGPSLAEIIEGEAPVSAERAVDLLRPLAEALDYAHGQGLIHRDVKPSNAILSPDARPVLTDFGLVKAAEESGSSAVSLTLSQTGMTLGTPAYMAPEQADPKAVAVDQRADLYSLGVIAYELLTGRVPFTGNTPLAVAMGHLLEPPPPPRDLNPALSEATEAALLKALEKKPEARFPSAVALVEALSIGTAPPPVRAIAPEYGPQVETASPEEPGEAAEQASAFERASPPVAVAAAAGRRSDAPSWLVPVVVGVAALVGLVLSIVWATGFLFGDKPTPTSTRVPPTFTPAPAVPVAGDTATLAPLPILDSTPRGQPEPTATLAPTLTELPGPPTARLSSPESFSDLQGYVTFKWTYDGILSSGEAFQVLIWKEGAAEHLGAAQALAESKQTINLDSVPQLMAGGPGQYLWSVVVLRRDTDQRLSSEAPSRRFTYLGPAGSSMPAVGDPMMRAKDGMVMVYVPAGDFTMGSTDAEMDATLELCSQHGYDCERSWYGNEQPAHDVYLKGYWIDRTEVTNAQYRAFVNATGHRPPATCDWGEPTYGELDRADHPVVCVSWADAVDYCEWAGGRLPTEAEWEKAARGTDRREYPWGDGWQMGRCNTEEAGIGDTKSVGSYPAGASPYGALDMAGNVWEWISDWYDPDYYSNSPEESPQGRASSQGRVLRGGSWYVGLIQARSAYRRGNSPAYRFSHYGFRCVVMP